MDDRRGQGDRAGLLQRAGERVEAVAVLLLAQYAVRDDGAVEAGVLGDLLDRTRERFVQQVEAHVVVLVVLLVQLLQHLETIVVHHALHHLVPSIPYHNMPEAHERLMQHLPADSPYRATIFPSLWAAVSQVFADAGRERTGGEGDRGAGGEAAHQAS